MWRGESIYHHILSTTLRASNSHTPYTSALATHRAHSRMSDHRGVFPRVERPSPPLREYNW
jgi:hypothetical protein